MNKVFQKIILLVAIIFAITSSLMSQKADNFTLKAHQSWLANAGLNGDGTFSLYDYLGQGKPVVIDFSATWCSPCWNFHKTGTLDLVYSKNGPTGFPGVNANTTNKYMVFWIEGDGATADNTMTGSSLGNWTEPTSGKKIQFPMFNPVQSVADVLMGNFNCQSYPTLYRVCPDKTITEITTETESGITTSLNACPALNLQNFDPEILAYTGTTSTCGPIKMKIKLSNNGKNPLTACTIVAKNGNTVIKTINWTGSLNTYGTSEVDFGAYNISANTTLTFSITDSNDPNQNNNTINQAIAFTTVGGNSTSCKIDITLDKYGSETSWKITNLSDNTVKIESPTYTNGTSNTPRPQPAINVTLDNNKCYLFEIFDSFGDGMNSQYGAGSYKVSLGSTAILTGGTFTKSEAKAFTVGSLGSEINTLNANIAIYPNPAQSEINIANAERAQVSIYNTLGQEVYSLSVSESIETINIKDLPQGTYIVKAIRDNDVHTSNIVITK